jgi:hypothetical protein
MLNPPLLFGFASEYTIRKVQKNQEELEMNGAHNLLPCAGKVEVLLNILKCKTNYTKMTKNNFQEVAMLKHL